MSVFGIVLNRPTGNTIIDCVCLVRCSNKEDHQLFLILIQSCFLLHLASVSMYLRQIKIVFFAWTQILEIRILRLAVLEIARIIIKFVNLRFVLNIFLEGNHLIRRLTNLLSTQLAINTLYKDFMLQLSWSQTSIHIK